MKEIRKHPNKQQHNWLAYKLIERFLLDHIPMYKGDLYDLGCGEAPFRGFFLKHVPKYVGVDWAASYHDTNADIIADLNEPLPIESDVADTVVSISVLEHLREPQNMISEAFRILRPGGCLVLQVPWQWWVHEAPYDYFRYTPYGLKYICAKAGFVDIRVEPVGGFFSMFILKFNYFSSRFVMGPRPFRWAIKALLIPMWYAGQWAAPILDKLDRNWQLEAAGYNVTARKPYKG
jgi:SAM-dependent methyltransferase